MHEPVVRDCPAPDPGLSAAGGGCVPVDTSAFLLPADASVWFLVAMGRPWGQDEREGEHRCYTINDLTQELLFLRG